MEKTVWELERTKQRNTTFDGHVLNIKNIKTDIPANVQSLEADRGVLTMMHDFLC